MKSITALAFVFATFFCNSQSNNTFFLGHSLINFNMPNMVNKLSIAGAKNFEYEANIGNGANLLFHWNNPTSGQGSPWNTTLPLGGFEHFILTEAVPLLGHLEWSSTYRIADSLYQFAMTNNPDIQYYLYETWHCTNTGTPGGCQWDNDDGLLWRPRLTADLPKWEGIADSINAIHTNDMLIIPAGQALGQLSDSIDAGLVPGFTSIEDLFSDDIHLTETGNYFIACVMYGVIHKESPVGLPNQLTSEWDVPYTNFPTPAQAAIFQRIAWNTLCDYPRDGVNCLTSNIEDHTQINFAKVVPNPAQQSFTILSDRPLQVQIMSANGTNIYSNDFYTNEKITISDSGIYFLIAKDESQHEIREKIVITN